jgi:hypothetical protein
MTSFISQYRTTGRARTLDRIGSAHREAHVLVEVYHREFEIMRRWAQ